MDSYCNAFERWEKKYLLTQAQYDALLIRAAPMLTPDPHPNYTVCSLYFDSPDYALIRASLSHPDYKEKFRIRSYGIPDLSDTVYLEVKQKLNGMVFKRRTAMTLAQCKQYLDDGLSGQPCVTLREVDWMFHRYQLQPKALISCRRTSYCDKASPAVRLTFDRDLQFRGSDLLLEHKSGGQPLLPEGVTLLEIKTPGGMPLWLAKLLGELGICNRSFSKYGAAFQRYLSKSVGGTHHVQ